MFDGFAKKRVRVAEPIRRLGEHSASVRLAENVSVDIVVVVAPDENSDAPVAKEAEVEAAPAVEEVSAPAEESAESEAAE